MDLKLFTNNLGKYAQAFTPSKLTDKIGDVSKKAGLSAIYSALLLYNSLTDPNVSTTDKLLITAALGYFIMPLDVIPDLLPGGLVDDGAVLAYAAKSIYNNINPDTHAKSKNQLKKWFSNFSDSDLYIHG